MKVEREKQFAPVHIILETQEEVDKVYAMFDYDMLYDGLELSGWIKDLWHYASRNYGKFQNKIDELIRGDKCQF